VHARVQCFEARHSAENTAEPLQVNRHQGACRRRNDHDRQDRTPPAAAYQNAEQQNGHCRCKLRPAGTRQRQP
jgi:hypothetical protein